MRPPNADDLELIGRFLARRDLPALDAAGSGRFDVLVLCASAVLASLEVTARAFSAGLVGRVLVTGGLGHSTPYLVRAVQADPRYAEVDTAGRPEAGILAELLERHWDVPGSRIGTETASTNCGENAAFSLAALAGSGARSVLLVQDPTMQRRTHAGFDFSQREVPPGDRVEVTSYAPFLPVVGPAGVGPLHGSGPTWTLDRFTSLALGEVRRLHDDAAGYGPRGAGYIGHVDVPAEVLDAAARVQRIVRPELRSR